MALKEAVKAVDENKLQDLQVIHRGAQVERKIEAKAKVGNRWRGPTCTWSQGFP